MVIPLCYRRISVIFTIYEFYVTKRRFFFYKQSLIEKNSTSKEMFPTDFSQSAESTENHKFFE